MQRRIASVGLSATIAGFVLVVGHAPSGRAEQPNRTGQVTESVTIKNFEFAPPTITVAAGGTVRWINMDVANHQITTGVVDRDRPRPDGRISSPLLFRGDEFSASFATPGEFPYYCGVHPFMRGTIAVK